MAVLFVVSPDCSAASLKKQTSTTREEEAASTPLSPSKHSSQCASLFLCASIPHTERLLLLSVFSLLTCSVVERGTSARNSLAHPLLILVADVVVVVVVFGFCDRVFSRSTSSHLSFFLFFFSPATQSRPPLVLSKNYFEFETFFRYVLPLLMNGFTQVYFQNIFILIYYLNSF